MTIKEFQKIWDTFKASKSNLPAHAVPRRKPGDAFTDKTAIGLEKLIVCFTRWQREANGVPVLAAKINVVGTYRPGVGFTVTNATKGVSDIWMTYFGRSICVEVKVGKDRPSEWQKKFEERQKMAGGEYRIVKSWDEFYQLWLSLN